MIFEIFNEKSRNLWISEIEGLGSEAQFVESFRGKNP